jgi:NADPH2:quinone reductase
MPHAILCERIGNFTESLQSVDLPSLDSVPSGALKVRVACAGLSFPDLLQVAGKYQQKLKPPFVPGAEIAGEIVALGSDVASKWKIGDRVGGWAALDSNGKQRGGLAEDALITASRAFKIPDAVSYEVAATMIRNYAVTNHAIETVMKLQKDDILLVLGAGGACGLVAIDLAQAIGARVVACVSSAEKAIACRAAGAEVVVDYKANDGKDFLPALREAKVYGKISAIFDPIGGKSAEDAFRALGPGGRHIIFGFASGGTNPQSAFPSFPINLLLMKGQQIRGSMGAAPPEKMQEMLQMVEEGRLRPSVNKSYALTDFMSAFEDLASGKAVGKVILSTTPNQAKL